MKCWSVRLKNGASEYQDTSLNFVELEALITSYSKKDVRETRRQWVWDPELGLLVALKK